MVQAWGVNVLIHVSVCTSVCVEGGGDVQGCPGCSGQRCPGYLAGMSSGGMFRDVQYSRLL